VASFFRRSLVSWPPISDFRRLGSLPNQPLQSDGRVGRCAASRAAERLYRWADLSRALMVHDFAAYQAFCDALNALKPGWQVTEGGLTGPDHAVVRFGEKHPSRSDGHLDVQFVPDDRSGQKSALWDCVSGFGATPLARAQTAAHLWANTTAPALLEFKYSRRGDFADHYHGDEPRGFAGWHVICGAIMGFGHDDSPRKLQSWRRDNPLLPALSSALEGSIDEGTCPHGIKIFFGGNGIAEVRLDGELHEGASTVLANLDWPRIEPAGFVRSYILALHRETPRK